MTEYNIAIVGGGANAVCVVNELVDQLSRADRPRNFKISVFEKSGVVGSGLAYGTNMDAHILNMPAESMSAIADKPGDFMEWLRKPHSPELHPYFNAQAQCRDFVPRKIFGYYLQDILDQAVQKASNAGIKVEFIRGEVTDIVTRGEELWLKAGDHPAKFNQGILCLGNQPPTIGRRLQSLPGYFHQPWPESDITEGIPKDADILVIGSGLTAVDTLITLQENNHEGSITFLSRHGLLPKVRTFPDQHELVHLSPENVRAITARNQRKLSVDEAVELFNQEFESAGVDMQQLDFYKELASKAPAQVLKEDIQKAKNGSLPYFSVLKAIDEVVGELWNELSIEARQVFDTHYRTLWNIYDYPMPVQNAERVLKALESGQLKIVSGFRDIQYDTVNGEFVLQCVKSDCNDTDIKTHRGPYVINAVGNGLDLTRIQSPLIQNALMRGIITPHLLGGVDVDFETGGVKDGHGHYSQRLFAIGSLTRGVHFYTNSIQENAKAARNAAIRVAGTALADKPVLNPSTDFQPKGGTNE